MSNNTMKSTKGYFSFFPLILYLTVFISCQHRKISPAQLDIPFSAAVEYYSIADTRGWSEELILEENNINFIDSIDYFGGFYHYKKAVNDTIEFLSLEYYESLDDTILIPKEYNKWFKKDFTQHVLQFGENGDTLFYYTASLFGSQPIVFQKGKYNYQYMFNLLSDHQRKYYITHQDSLSKIYGNNLPPLPEK